MLHLSGTNVSRKGQSFLINVAHRRAVPKTQKPMKLGIIHLHAKKKADDFYVTTNIPVISRAVY